MNVFDEPEQVKPALVYLGVTTMVAVTGRVVALIAVKLAILPVPLAARPIDVLLLVHVNTVPGTVPLKFTGAVEAPAQTDWLAG